MTTWPTVMVTGHRPQHLSPSVHDWVRFELHRLAVKLRAEHGMTTGISGMAIGADLWWADALISNGIPLWAHVPFPQQSDRWRVEDRDDWARLCRVAHKLTTYGGYYDVKTLHARNDGMIRVSAAAIAVLCQTRPTAGPPRRCGRQPSTVCRSSTSTRPRGPRHCGDRTREPIRTRTGTFPPTQGRTTTLYFLPRPCR
jgi:hypothetical protein